jgi:hypothetical protein
MPFEQAGGVGKGLRKRRLGLVADDDLTFFGFGLGQGPARNQSRDAGQLFLDFSSNQAQPISAERVAESLQHSWRWSLIWSL